jgi:hypothetical protein
MSKGITSYERVYRALFETSTCKDAWNAALKDLGEIKIEKVTWSLSQSTDESSALATFHFNAGFAWGEKTVSSSDIDARTVMTAELARKVIDIHFGSDKDVKTFNCNANVVRRGGTISRKTKYGREQDYQEDFHDWLLSRFREEATDQMKAATKKAKADVKKMEATNEFRQARQEALVGFCKDDITKALLPWHNMEQQVLQDAWDQFICTAIMRT